MIPRNYSAGGGTVERELRMAEGDDIKKGAVSVFGFKEDTDFNRHREEYDGFAVRLNGYFAEFYFDEVGDVVRQV